MLKSVARHPEVLREVMSGAKLNLDNTILLCCAGESNTRGT